jgi:hypothetical protein
MGSTVFTGPVLAGNVLNSDGSGNLAAVGGSNGTQNVGFCEMVQAATITQSATAASTTIVIPAQSLITDIYLNVTVAWTNSATLGIGTTSAANQLVAAIANANLVQGQYRVPVTSLIANWNNSNNTQDVQIYVQSSAAPVATTGSAILIIKYVQGYNGFTNGQYT